MLNDALMFNKQPILVITDNPFHLKVFNCTEHVYNAPPKVTTILIYIAYVSLIKRPTLS